MSLISRALGLLKPGVPAGQTSEIPLGTHRGGSLAGTIMPDGMVVRGEGEPPVYKYGAWWPPSKRG